MKSTEFKVMIIKLENVLKGYDFSSDLVLLITVIIQNVHSEITLIVLTALTESCHQKLDKMHTFLSDLIKPVSVQDTVMVYILKLENGKNAHKHENT